MRGREKEIYVHGKDGENGSWADLAAAAVEKGAGDAQEHVQKAPVFSFEHGVYAVVNEGTVESVSVVETGGVDLRAGGRGLSLNGGVDGAEELEYGGADRKKERWERDGPVVKMKDCDMRRSMAASSRTLQTPS